MECGLPGVGGGLTGLCFPTVGPNPSQTNDENMQHDWVYDWGSETGRQLFIDFVQSEIASGNVDGMFADKWGYECKEVNDTT